MNQLVREIHDVTIPELFEAYHPKNHVFRRHVQVTRKDLRQRLRKIPYVEDEIVTMSRFDSKDAHFLTRMIFRCLYDNQGEIQKWIKENPFHLLQVCMDVDAPIGEGVVKGTDWNQFFPMSRIHVVLKYSNLPGRLFQIVTAYPVPNLDETDQIWEAIDSWSEHIQKGSAFWSLKDQSLKAAAF